MRPTFSAPSEQKFPSPDHLVDTLNIGLPEFGWIHWVNSTGSTNADLIQRARRPIDAVRLKYEHSRVKTHVQVKERGQGQEQEPEQEPEQLQAQAQAQAHEQAQLQTQSARFLPNSQPPWLLGAHLQTAGKGRAGRPWQNLAGECLMFSCAFEPQIPLTQLPGIAPALGVATCLALRSSLGNPAQLQLKWPNDLQWAGAKLAGLLIETAPAFSGLASSTENPKRPPMVIVGMGLNLTGATALSAHLQRPIADLGQLLKSDALPIALRGHHIPPATLITQIARAWQQALSDYKIHGYAAFAQGFDQVDALAGQYVHVIDQGKVLHQGLAQGTDVQGRLKILTDTGLVPVLVGDVSIRPAGNESVILNKTT